MHFFISFCLGCRIRHFHRRSERPMHARGELAKHIINVTLYYQSVGANTVFGLALPAFRYPVRPCLSLAFGARCDGRNILGGLNGSGQKPFTVGPNSRFCTTRVHALFQTADDGTVTTATCWDHGNQWQYMTACEPISTLGFRNRCGFSRRPCDQRLYFFSCVPQ